MQESDDCNGKVVRRRTYVFTAVFGSYFLVELLVSHTSHSLTLLIDAYHTLYNFMALFSYIIAIKMSHEHTLKNTFGWARIEVISVMVSILALSALCFSTAVEAVQTALHASHSDAMHHPIVVLGIGVTGVVLNLICFLFIGGFSYSHSFVHVSPQEVQVNVTLPQTVIAGTRCLSSASNGEEGQRSTTTGQRFRFCQHLCWDLCCSILVIVCSLVVHNSNGKVALYIDPALSLLASIFLLSTSYSFVKESGMILLQTVPSNMDIAGLKANLIKQFPAVNNVHDLHVWRLTKDKVIATAHIMFESPKAYAQIGGQVSNFFKEVGISQTTIQPEFIKDKEAVDSATIGSQRQCVLRCETVECEHRTCCNEKLKSSDDAVQVTGTTNANEQTASGIRGDQEPPKALSEASEASSDQKTGQNVQSQES